MALVNSPTLTWRILRSAIEVHRHLGPGLLESAYRECLVDEMSHDGLSVQREVPIPIVFRGRKIDFAYRADLIVEKEVLVELKAVEHLLPVHEAQTLTYMRLGGLHVGLLLNFHATLLKDGVRRFVY